jgi:D-3-phosphoglycerate dehydrogenase
VLVLTPLAPAGLDALRRVALVDVAPAIEASELAAVIGDYHGVVVDGNTPLQADLIERAYRLRVIGCTGLHLDQIDVTAARDMGIEVRAAAAGSTVAVAELTLSLLLRLATAGQRGALANKTLGLIGFGRVGREVARRARAFDMRILVNQPRLTPELALEAGVEAVDLEALLVRADFVSLHVPYNQETRNLLGAAELGMVRSGTCLINTSHAGLVDAPALTEALRSGRLGGAAVTDPPAQFAALPQLLGVPRLTPQPEAADPSTAAARDRELAEQLVDVLRVRPPSEALSLLVVPAEQVLPHEHTDQKRVDALAVSLTTAGRLVNPPIVTPWGDQYVVLDGATRSAALRQLGYPYLIVQVVPTDREGFALHTWYHVVSHERPAGELLRLLESLPGLRLTPVPLDQAHALLRSRDALCYLIDRGEQAYLAETDGESEPLTVLNGLVDTYTRWGHVERSLQADFGRLLGLHPNLRALVVFPQFTPETVFGVAARGELMPAGLTRFIIPGRILRLNLELEQLRRAEPLAAKRAWFEQFLADKLSRSKLRYYQEPVILLDD